MTDALCRFVLRLYPAEFRRSFGDEWLEIARWRLQNSAGPLRGFARWIVVDALAALPAAWRGELRPQGHGCEARQDSRRNGGTRMSPSGSGALRTPGRGPGPMPPRHGWVAGALGALAARADEVVFAARSLRRSPGYAAAVIFTLALGIAASAGIFAVVDAVLLQPLPYDDAERLAMVWNDFTESDLTRLPLSAAQVLALRNEADLFEQVGGVWATSSMLTGLEQPLQVSMGMVTSNFHQVLRVQPALGRNFTERDDLAGDGPAVILSNELWQSAFGADPAVIGSMVDIEGEPTPVVGVLPPGFRMTFATDSSVPGRLDLYMSYPTPLPEVSAGQYFLRVVGRLQAGVTVEQVRERLAAIDAAVQEQYVDVVPPGVRMTVQPLHADAVRTARPVLQGLMGGVGLVLLLGCANAAGLLSTRMARQRRELATRRCLGASRGRIARQQLIEGLLLAGLAGALGTLAGYTAVRLAWPMRPEMLSRFTAVPFTAPIAAVAVASVLLAVAIFTAVGALQLPRVAGALGAPGAVHPSRWRRGRFVLPVGEVAITVVLLTTAGLVAQSVIALQRVPVGFDAGEQLSFRVSLSAYRFPAAERVRLARLIEEEVAALPGVTAVGGSSHLPFDDVPNWSSSAAPEEIPEAERDAYYTDHRSITAGYLRALGARLIDGRDFTAQDETRTDNLVIVDRALAQRYWPDRRAVGRTLVVTQYRDGDFVPAPATVIGVVETVRHRDLTAGAAGTVFLPFAQSARWQLSYVVQARSIEGLNERIRERVAQLGAGVAAAHFRPLRAGLHDALAPVRLAAILAELFAAAAVCLAFAGLYAVLAFGVTQRRAEIGVRMALGASGSSIFRRIVGDGIRVGLAGLVLGVPAALLAGRALGGLVFGVAPSDVATIAAVIAGTLLISIAATALPAWYAARVDPVRSLRA